MPDTKLQVLQLRPGVNREGTSYSGEGGWYACDKVRFRSGLPEKLGGWVPYGTGEYLGSCKLYVEFVSLSNNYILGVGTNLKFYLLVGGQYYDITPIRYTSTLGANAFISMYSTLSAGISATDTIIPITNATASNMDLIAPFVVKIGSEEIYVPAVDGGSNTLGTTGYSCVRGYNGTTAAAHSTSAAVSSSWVVVDDTGNGATPGDFVTFSGVAGSAFGGYTTAQFNDEFEIQASSTNYIIFDTGTYSTSAASGGNAGAEAAYQIYTGLPYTGLFNGWGAGPYGIGHGWGTGYPGVGIAEELRLWSGCNYGQVLYFNVRNGGIYVWDAGTEMSSSGVVTGRGYAISDHSTDTSPASVPATQIVQGNYYTIAYVGTTDFTTIGAASNTVGISFVATGAAAGTGYVYDPATPTVATCITVTDERYIVAFGSNDYFAADPTAQDPMFIAWSDQEQPQVWYPQVTNTAGNYRLTYGSKIITSERTRQEILIWTDSALYSMQYLGAPYVYGFNPISTDVTIVSPNAMATAAGVTYWMGQDKFYAYSGRVDTLPCALRQYVFDDLNTNQWDLVFCGTNEKYNEIWWFYPSTGSVVNDSYVVYNYLEKLWYYGKMDRSAWLDSHIIGNPLGAVNNITVEHEVGADDGSVNPPQPIAAYIESSDFDLGDGGYQFSFVKRLIPDMDFIGSTNANPSVAMTLLARNYPGQPYPGYNSNGNIDPMQNTTVPVQGKNYTVQVYGYTQQAWIRLRGRQLIFRVGSTDLGVKWQLGSPRLQISPDGRR